MKTYSLNEVPAGHSVTFCGFESSLDALLQNQFLAYGIAVGQDLQVLQQRPMTIIACDHTELAIEHSIAAAMLVSD